MVQPLDIYPSMIWDDPKRTLEDEYLIETKHTSMCPSVVGDEGVVQSFHISRPLWSKSQCKRLFFISVPSAHVPEQLDPADLAYNGGDSRAGSEALGSRPRSTPPGPRRVRRSSSPTSNPPARIEGAPPAGDRLPAEDEAADPEGCLAGDDEQRREGNLPFGGKGGHRDENERAVKKTG